MALTVPSRITGKLDLFDGIGERYSDFRRIDKLSRYRTSKPVKRDHLMPRKPPSNAPVGSWVIIPTVAHARGLRVMLEVEQEYYIPNRYRVHRGQVAIESR